MIYKYRQSGKVFYYLIVALAGLAIGFYASVLFSNKADNSESNSETVQEEVWICSMHPQIRQPEPGKCPICFMDLIKEDSSIGETMPGEIEFSENAIKLMELQTAKVERKSVFSEVRLTGRVTFDETTIKHVTSWTAGRLERLFVDFTGTRVILGDHMVKIYSPELINAQAEFLQAKASYDTINDDDGDLVKHSVQATFKAGREKLKLLGLTEAQIKSIEESGKPEDFVTINAPSSGIVIEKHLNEGAYVKTGTEIYTIADMSVLWVMLDAYEPDLQWLRYGQQVEFNTEAYPGEMFNGVVSFISPVVDERTRSIKVRVNVDNRDRRLKPDMFVRATIKSQVVAEGEVMVPEMAGKWICPMHPSVVKESKDICDICQMDLVTTEFLGYFKPEAGKELPLVIPVSAPLITGKRAIVYIKVPGKMKPTFAGKEVVLGPRAGGFYLVVSGLDEGDEVVTNGNFKIDSALQIQADYSMMNPREPDENAILNAKGIQTLCPVMGNPINKEIFVEYKGKKVYFCCDGCDDMFLEDPAKYIDKLPQFKVGKVDDNDEIEQTLCPVMGNPINKDIFVEYKGRKVYFCCDGCDDMFLENPEKYLDKLPQFKDVNKVK